jgi:hypothetical protein
MKKLKMMKAEQRTNIIPLAEWFSYTPFQSVIFYAIDFADSAIALITD